jgi:hypothetical protein
MFGDEYVNRKGFPSINVQATCNEKYIFTSIDASWPGSVHDSRVLKNSSLYQLLLNGHHASVILADEGYGISPFIMTPFKNAITNVEKRYNKIHTKNRVVIEQSFGQLKRRFPMLRYGLRLKLESIPMCIVACFMLHNIAKFLGDADFNPEDFEEEFLEAAFVETEQLPANQLKIRGEQRRREIAELL